MSQNQSRRVELQISTEAAIIAMGPVSPAMFSKEPWKDPSVARLRAYSSGYDRRLPAEYKITASQ